MNVFFTKSFLAVLVSFLMVCPSPSNAQGYQPSTMRLGLYGNYGLNIYSGDFSRLEGVPSCCPGYYDGIGWGLESGLMLEYAFSEDFLFGFRAGYEDYSGIMEKVEPITISLDGREARGEFTHSIDFAVSGFQLYPYISYRPFPSFNIMLGPELGFIGQPTFSQKEEITEPANRGVFLDENGDASGKRTRKEEEGDVPNANRMLAFLQVGLGYELPMNSEGTLVLVPELFYGFGLTPFLDQDSTVTISTLKGGVSLKYRMFEEETPSGRPILRDTVFIRDTVYAEVEGAGGAVRLSSSDIEEVAVGGDPHNIRVNIMESYLAEIGSKKVAEPVKESLALGLVAKGLNPSGEETDLTTLVIKEFVSTEIRPLLPFVFFEKNSAEVPKKYLGESGDLASKAAPGAYYRQFDTLSARVRRAGKTSRISLTGIANEEEGASLAVQRAENVKRVLTDRYGIAGGSIATDSRVAKVDGSVGNTADREAENRAVEIRSDYRPLLDVVYLNDTVTVTNPPIVRLYPSASGDIAEWSITAYDNGAAFKTFSGVGAPPESLEWYVEREGSVFSNGAENIDMVFTATGADGETYTHRAGIKYRQELLSERTVTRESDMVIGRYELILFDFNSAELKQEHLATINMVKREVTPDSKIIIEGFTDRIGDEALNEDLARRRAEAVAKNFPGNDVSIVPVGEKTEFYDNDYPEGRMYSRTVRIVTQTPVR